MSFDMRLFQKRGWYHVEIERNRSRALRTQNEAEALALIAAMEKERLVGRLASLDGRKRTTLSQLKKEYIEYREGLNDLSAETIRKDNLSLKLLEDAIGGSTLLATITAKKSTKIDDFKNICLRRGAKKISINGYLRQLRPAFKWAVKEGHCDAMPDITMYKRLKSTEEQLPDRILEPAEIDNLLTKACERSAIWGIYCTVVLWTGGRRREALSAQWQKTDFDNDEITLTGKTGSRVVPMLKPVKKIFKPIKKDIGPIFPDWHPDTVSHWFQETAQAAGIDGHRLHDLRHTCATYLLKNGVALEVVQRIMGHKNISTTQIYAKVVDEVMKREMKKLKFK